MTVVDSGMIDGPHEPYTVYSRADKHASNGLDDKN